MASVLPSSGQEIAIKILCLKSQTSNIKRLYYQGLLVYK